MESAMIRVNLLTFLLAQNAVIIDSNFCMPAPDLYEVLVDISKIKDLMCSLKLSPFGLCMYLSWEAFVLQAVVLCEYLTQNPEIVRGRRVLELGAGTGLAGMVAAIAGYLCIQCSFQRLYRHNSVWQFVTC